MQKSTFLAHSLRARIVHATRSATNKRAPAPLMPFNCNARKLFHPLRNFRNICPSPPPPPLFSTSIRCERAFSQSKTTYSHLLCLQLAQTLPTIGQLLLPRTKHQGQQQQKTATISAQPFHPSNADCYTLLVNRALCVFSFLLPPAAIHCRFQFKLFRFFLARDGTRSVGVLCDWARGYLVPILLSVHPDTHTHTFSCRAHFRLYSR